MRRKFSGKVSYFLLYRGGGRSLFCSSPFSSNVSHYHHLASPRTPRLLCLKSLCNSLKDDVPAVPTSIFLSSSVPQRLFSSSFSELNNAEIPPSYDAVEDVEPIDSWEEEDDETEPEIGDGSDGGGVVLQNCPWGERALSIANEVILRFGDDMKLYAFKTSPRGYIYVRLDKLSNEYGCPSMEEIESFSKEYKAKLDDVGAAGDIPEDLALEVSSPGAERLLKVPDDLDRFKDMIMRVSYVENLDTRCPVKDGVFLLESVETESGCCVWKLADVKENRDPLAKGRPLSRKQKDWRLRLPYETFKKITLYLDY